MKQLNHEQREAFNEWKCETEQPPMIGFARAVWAAVAFWLAFALFVLASLPAHAQGYRVPPFYNGCEVPAGIKVIHVNMRDTDALCRVHENKDTPYFINACYLPRTKTMILPFANQIGRAWYAEMKEHETAHANVDHPWAADHPRLKHLDKVRACK